MFALSTLEKNQVSLHGSAVRQILQNKNRPIWSCHGRFPATGPWKKGLLFFLVDYKINVITYSYMKRLNRKWQLPPLFGLLKSGGIQIASLKEFNHLTAFENDQ